MADFEDSKVSETTDVEPEVDDETVASLPHEEKEKNDADGDSGIDKTDITEPDVDEQIGSELDCAVQQWVDTAASAGSGGSASEDENPVELEELQAQAKTDDDEEEEDADDDGPHQETEPVGDSNEDPDTSDRGPDDREDSKSGVPSLFVSRLPCATTSAELREHFEKYGKVKKAKMMGREQKEKNRTKKPQIRNGFVTMSTMEETEAALNDVHEINGKIVNVAISKPRDAPERRFRINLSSLDKDKTSQESLTDYFGQFGTVNKCFLSFDKKGDKIILRGSGYVVMTSMEETDAVMAANDSKGFQVIDGARVAVKRLYDQSHDLEKQRRLWFGGLDKDKTKEEHIQQHFGTFGPVLDCVLVRDLPLTEGGECKSRGYGFITMSSVKDVETILRFPGGHKLHRKTVVFNRLLPAGDKSFIYPSLQLQRKLFVTGFAGTSLTGENLKNYFCRFGDVKFVNFVKDGGYAHVVMKTAADAQKIAHMRDHYIFKHWLLVESLDPQRHQPLLVDELQASLMSSPPSQNNRSRGGMGGRYPPKRPLPGSFQGPGGPSFKRGRSDNHRGGRSNKSRGYSGPGNNQGFGGGGNKGFDNRQQRNRRGNFNQGQSGYSGQQNYPQNPYYQGGGPPNTSTGYNYQREGTSEGSGYSGYDIGPMDYDGFARYF